MGSSVFVWKVRIWLAAVAAVMTGFVPHGAPALNDGGGRPPTSAAVARDCVRASGASGPCSSPLARAKDERRTRRVLLVFHERPSAPPAGPIQGSMQGTIR